MRCLTLAGELLVGGAEVSFICRDLPGNLCEFLSEKGLQVFRLSATPMENGTKGPTDHSKRLGVSCAKDREETLAILHQYRPDWLVVDHYALNADWEFVMRSDVGKIMVIDDLADRVHDCDLLLDQNLYDGWERRYDGLVPDHCMELLGPRYALLRPEFASARKTLRRRDGQVRKILVFFGGSDPSNETARALEAIRRLNRADIPVDVIVGASNPSRDLVRTICEGMPATSFHVQVENMAEFMANADLAIGASGTATWERCCLGLPSVLVSIALNQVEIGEGVGSHSCAIYLGKSGETDPEDIRRALVRIIGDPEEAVRIGRNAALLVDGLGTTRVWERMRTA